MSVEHQTPASLRIACVMLLLVAVLSPGVRAVPAEEDLERTRSELLQAQEMASEQARRSAELESALLQYDARVRQARESVEDATRRSLDTRARILETQNLIAALQEQLDGLHEANTERRALLEEHKDQLVAFVRYVALNETVSKETGPAAAGAVVRSLLQGSLSEAVEENLYNDAFLRARTIFVVRLVVLQEEGRQAVERLQAVAAELGDELVALLDLREELLDTRHAAASDFDAQMRTRALTQAELLTIRQTVDEAHARVFDVQRNLARINEELRDHMNRRYETRIAEQRQHLRALELQRNEHRAEEKRLHAVKEEADRAFDAMEAARNSDRRQYLRVEDVKFEIRRAQEALKALADLPDIAPEDEEERAVYRAMRKERDTLDATIASLREKLSFLERGYPEPEVVAYLAKRNAGQHADARLRRIREELAGMDVRFADTEAAIAALEEQWEEEKALLRASEAIARAFAWPVTGRRITAGFMEPSYQRYFGVPHRGIDIAIPQGSPVYAITDGIVQTVRDGGRTGYSYVLIAHRDGYTSLYGHLLKAYVSPGDFVDQRQLIGLSGGQPGTPGAGLMTTGPHLHLEIHKNGQYVDPLTLLSL